MSHPLLSSLEKKVRILLTELASLRLEISQLEQENQQLKAQQKQWEEQLTSLLERFDHIDQNID